MTASRRVQRVERELREIVGMYLLAGTKYPINGMVTVTRVSVSPDLRNARVFVTMMATDEEKAENLEALKESTPDLQHQIHKQLPMKFCPKVKFEIDKGYDNVQLVEQRLKEIHEGDED